MRVPIALVLLSQHTHAVAGAFSGQWSDQKRVRENAARAKIVSHRDDAQNFPPLCNWLKLISRESRRKLLRAKEMGGDRKSIYTGCVIFIPFLMALAPIITHSLGNKKELPPQRRSETSTLALAFTKPSLGQRFWRFLMRGLHLATAAEWLMNALHKCAAFCVIDVWLVLIAHSRAENGAWNFITLRNPLKKYQITF
jgi:hypothetical protein